MKKLIPLFTMTFLVLLVSSIANAELINVNGNCFLDGQTNHEGIKVLFTRTIPSFLIDSTFTNVDGSFEIDLEQGIYEIKYSKSGFYGEEIFNQGIYPNVSLPDITLAVRTKILLVPSVYESIQEAINDALTGDTVLISPGTYSEDINYLGKAIVVGSYYLTTTDTSYISQTIIEGTSSFPAVRFSNNETESSELIGIKIQGSISNGSGIICYESSPVILRCVISNFTSNSPSAGIRCLNSNAHFISCLITNNHHEIGTYGANGGGINCSYSSVQFDDCMITNNNTEDDGGGIYSDYSNLQFTNCLIMNNNSEGDGGGIYSESSNLQFDNSLITHNNSEDDGGGVFSENSNLQFVNCNILNNMSDHGAGVCVSGQKSIFQNCVVKNNIANYSGAGLYIVECYITLFGCEVSNNILSSYSSSSKGGGVYSSESGLRIEYCTIVDNLLETDDITQGGAIYHISSSNSDSLTISSSIVCNNFGATAVYSTSVWNPKKIEYSNFFNNEGGSFFNVPIWVGVDLILNNNGDSCDVFFNTQLDPMFVDGNNGDYFLLPSSPCIDAGKPYSMFDPDCSVLDMGAYYYHQDLNIVNANFTSNKVIGDTPLDIDFNDSSCGDITSWAWDFNNDGIIESFEKNPTWTFNIVGKYSISLTVGNDQGNSSMVTKEDYITVKDELIPDFIADTTVVLRNSNIYFSDLSSGVPNAWQWDFNEDGIIDKTQQNPYFYYNTPGVFDVMLRITDELGRVDTLIKENYITVVDYVNSNFTADPLNAQVPVTVLFSDQSTGDPNYWEWDFQNDGTIDSYEQNPAWTYELGGNYTVKLFVSNGYGSDYETKYNYLNLYEPVGPTISSILDVPFDQGRKVVVNWEKCLYDQQEANSVENYQVWRIQNWADTPWEFMGQIPAIQLNEYAFIAPTINDSSGNGIPYFTFMVSAITEDGGIYNSIPDSGYSVDNIAPNAPQDLSGSFDNGVFTLQWTRSDDLDFGHYAVYKETEDLAKTGIPYAVLSDTTFDDNSIEEEVYFYTISAFDINGNESTNSPPIEAPIQKVIEIPSGWSGVSSYIQPYNPQMEDLLSPIENSLIIIQNGDSVFWPEQGVNTLGEWNPVLGYSIKTSEATEIQFMGFWIEDNTMLLPAGWSVMPILVSCEIASDQFFTQVEESFIAAKEVAGWRMYWPAMGVNTLNVLEPGKAYFIYMMNEGTVVFPECD